MRKKNVTGLNYRYVYFFFFFLQVCEEVLSRNFEIQLNLVSMNKIRIEQDLASKADENMGELCKIRMMMMTDDHQLEELRMRQLRRIGGNLKDPEKGGETEGTI